MTPVYVFASDVFGHSICKCFGKIRTIDCQKDRNTPHTHTSHVHTNTHTRITCNTDCLVVALNNAHRRQALAICFGCDLDAVFNLELHGIPKLACRSLHLPRCHVHFSVCAAHRPEKIETGVCCYGYQVCCYGYQTGSGCTHIIRRAANYGLSFEDARGLLCLLRGVRPLVVVARHDGFLLS